MNQEQVATMLTNHQARIEHLEEYEEKQNGRLERLEAKLDKMQWWITGALLTAVMNLGGIVVSLVILIRRG